MDNFGNWGIIQSYTYYCVNEMGNEVCKHCSVRRLIDYDKRDMLVKVRLDVARGKDIPSVFTILIHLMDGNLAGDDVPPHLPVNIDLLHRFFISENKPRRITEEGHEGGVPLE